MADPVQVVVNGEPLSLDGALTVAGLLEHLDLAGSPCAVELNERVVPRRDHEAAVIGDGDRIEIVTLVGGG
jgi:sulfur carrier protein